MANTALGDIPGARFPLGGANASLASSGANGRLIEIGIAPHDMRVRSAWWTPTGGDQGTAASYRNVKLINGGTAGTGTAVVASLALSASKASLTPASMVADSAVTVPAGAMIYASQDTVLGTDATGTVLRAGRFDLAYEVI
jgi:hypothetical protein